MIGGGVDTRRVKKSIAGLSRRARNVAAALKAVRAVVRKDVRQHGTKGLGPDGKWPKRVRSKTGRSKRRPRRLLGRLTTALDLKLVSNRELVVTSLVPWSNIHQQGGKVGRGSRLPRRTFLWFSPWVIRQIREALQKHVGGGW